MNSSATLSLSNSVTDSPPAVTSHATATPHPTSIGINAPSAAATVSSAENAGLLPFPGATNTSGVISGRKKRGRPRKYDTDGNLPIGTPSIKRGRGRGSAHAKWQNLASSLGGLSGITVGRDFQPLVFTVNPGEDVSAKIISHTQMGFGGICVLSAVGGISKVSLIRSGSSGGVLTIEDGFQIVSLTGSFVISETSCSRSTDGALSVSLARNDGHVIGGGVANLLIASTPVQVVIGTFMPNVYKAEKLKYKRTGSLPAVAPTADTVTPAVPISQARPESEIDQLLEQSQVEGGGSNPLLMPITSFNPGWNRSAQTSGHGPSTDISLSVSSE